MSLTLAHYLAEKGDHRPAAAAIVVAAARACTRISSVLRHAHEQAVTAVSLNVQGEIQKPMDIVANEMFLTELGGLSQVSLVVSEELAEPVSMSREGRFAVLFDPLDGSSNLDVNVTVGSIFSVIDASTEEELLQPGRKQVAAGFAAYGPSTTLVITFGEASALFILRG